MALGPIEILVIEFPGSQFTGEIIPELERLIESDTISIIDGLLVKKDLERRRHLRRVRRTRHQRRRMRSSPGSSTNSTR